MLAIYLVILLWLVFFKLSFDFSAILHVHYRSLNLVPFAAPVRVNGRTSWAEMIENGLVFIPFGLLLNVNFSRPGFLKKLFLIFIFSLSVELIQYIFAIGASDITDLIANTTGGLLGLILYSMGNAMLEKKKLDWIIIVFGIILLTAFIALRSRITLDFSDKPKNHKRLSE